MSFKLPELTYDYKDLKPHIDAKTMEIHHSKHHNAYVTNLNVALEGVDVKTDDINQLIQELDKLPKEKQTAVRNNGGGHANHSLFWTILSKDGGGEPTGDFLECLNNCLGSFEKFKEEFAKAGATRFGSGWAWLVVNKDKKMEVCSTPNQDNPLMCGCGTPILGLDVWEHAYYLNYQNRRPDYISAFWNIVNWEEVAKRWKEAKK